MHTREEMLKVVNRIFIDAFDDDSIKVTESTSSADLEDWDSLMHITLITEVEKAFGIKFTLSEVGKMQDVGEMLDIIEKRATK